ncbi:TetR/AcrR family transcriptional regulator [Mycolicibacterium sp.]|uniref:TetR/AcrR family transcriptional regulator n=1 Tax=Mycolicibacterium sp. TaxID=2320850 RepID=UPI0037C79FD0
MVTKADQPAAPRPARGTRPANRRSLVLAAAADLFYRKGYAQVSMKEIAEAVGVGASALYRHFPSKQDLLHAVVGDALGVVDALLGRLLADPTVDLTAEVARTMLEHRAIGILWHAEARHLSDDARTQLREQLRGIGSRLAELIRHQRRSVEDATADLLAWCVLAVTTSVSFHSVELPTDVFVRLMAEMAKAAMEVRVPRLRRVSAPTAATDEPWSPSRREAILNAATKLFARNGFANVGIEDIGASVGIAGPSVYNHFAAKEDILASAIIRGRELLYADLRRQLSRAGNPRDALERLLSGYAEFVFESPESIQLLISETGYLSADEQHRTRAAQYEYIAEWVGLLRQLTPTRDPDECRVRVQAALGIVNDVAATPHLRAFGNVDKAAIAVSGAVLGLA